MTLLASLAFVLVCASVVAPSETTSATTHTSPVSRHPPWRHVVPPYSLVLEGGAQVRCCRSSRSGWRLAKVGLYWGMPSCGSGVGYVRAVVIITWLSNSAQAFYCLDPRYKWRSCAASQLCSATRVLWGWRYAHLKSSVLCQTTRLELSCCCYSVKHVSERVQIAGLC